MIDVDKEVDAIKAVLAALEPLSAEVRASVLEYVLRRLRIQAPAAPPPGSPVPEASSPGGAVLPPSSAVATPAHIKDLKDQKKPRSANEMAALVAYYLANIAPQPERKTTVNTKDIETYFKIADFRLPEQIRVTLPNARNAGYFDPKGDGEYQLNAIGHNLVVHSMPRGAGETSKKRRKPGTKRKTTRR